MNMEKEFKTLSEKIRFIKVFRKRPTERIYQDGILKKEIKEFIKKLLTPNNISKGFVEVSTIKYWAGKELI